jgi:tetratricopeptide (TPR) repeat protein
MKYWKHILIGASCLSFSFTFAQPAELADAWKDPGFVERFTGTFLPLTDQEPSINEKESELFQMLSELLATNQTGAAINQLTQYIRNAPIQEEVSAALNYTLANLHLQAGNFQEAMKQYEASIAKFENFRRAYKNLGLASIQARQFEPAVKTLVKAIELGDGSGDTFGLLAYAYLNTDNPTAALEGYRQASLLNPKNREWRIGKAEALMRTERYEEAIAEFKQLIEELPQRSAFYTSIANSYLSIGESSMAARYLEILRRQGGAKASALGLLGDIYVNDGLPSLAQTAYQDAIKTGNFSSARSIRALKAFIQRGYFTEADAFLASVEAAQGGRLSDDEAREVLNLRAQLALAKGQDEEAAGILEEVLAEDPLNGNALMLLGEYNHKRNDQESAIFYYERALQLPKFQRDAQLQLARIYVRQKEYQLAIRQLEGALSLEYSANVQDFLDAVRSVYNRTL